ncbi:thiol reductase thioredoxin [Mycobacterium alsense]|uniref:Thiol reductase thioredoxin n=1 Tax=Mycobacterium alsense TaxID=324058 RepID=A0AA41XKA9_9MYCO|nr:thioredoxin family protein [Mycobacterium alsense]MCV7377630.1 thioredoxin family protein [Mycobacterium alsense]OQZ92999.1 thiol reductase thioredoxin [Mycobacterium alsense]
MTTVAIASIVAALAAAALAGWLLTRGSGRLRAIDSAPGAALDTADLGLSRSGPTIVHFSAPWCGPCDRVRRVVEQVCSDVGDPGSPIAHVEIDLDANPAAARRFSVLSLPTTLIFDVDGRQRYRASGVPKAADLRSVLQPLLA